MLVVIVVMVFEEKETGKCTHMVLPSRHMDSSAPFTSLVYIDDGYVFPSGDTFARLLYFNTPLLKVFT